MLKFTKNMVKKVKVHLVLIGSCSPNSPHGKGELTVLCLVACQVEEDEQPETAIFKLDEKQVGMVKKLRETTT